MGGDFFVFPSAEELLNESDVEQKLIYPFVTAPRPFGLGYPASSVLTKSKIRPFEIGKGASRKTYFPDYVLTSESLPRVVVEAKGPSEPLDEAYREARLYAAEINALFPSGMNPLTHVVACNGLEIHLGHWDESVPKVCAKIADQGVANADIATVIGEIGFDKISVVSAQMKVALKPQLYKPRRMLGGLSVQNEEIGLNSFGARIQGELLHIFNPSSIEDRALVARKAYVGSRRRERYVDPIDRVIRAAIPPSHTDSKLLEDTSSPKEIISRLSNLKPLENKILLLIGTVGAGKTTFLDYLQTVALPSEVVQKTLWVRINMNAAPMASEEIYSWLRREVSEQCKAALPELDFEDIDVLQKLYSVEVNQFNKGAGKLFRADAVVYSTKLGELIENLISDEKKTAVACTRFCSTERGKLLVIAMDNCDKRTLDEQLLMFQAAQWLQKEFRCLIVLPLREETYDNYRDRPPLDTALKDLVFRIEPPLFQAVLHRRIQLALNQLSNHSGGGRRLTYDLPNGFRVEYGANEISFYLTSIVKSIFDHDRFIRRLITGLAGRNIRRALEIFIEFCTSGHIGEDQILRIKHAEGGYSLPLDIVTRVLLRANRRLYDSDYSYLKNVFSANWQDEDPNHFPRLMILRWLMRRISDVGPSGLRGYFSVSQLKIALVPLGLTEAIVEREINYLAKSFCVLSETYKTDELHDADLIRLAPAGFVHLDMLSNVDYLASLAEDTYFDKQETAHSVAETLRKGDRQYRREDALHNAAALVEMIQAQRERRAKRINIVSNDDAFLQLTDLSDSKSAIIKVRGNLFGHEWEDIDQKFKAGGIYQGVIVNPHFDHGLFVELAPGVTGLIPKRSLDLQGVSQKQYSELNELQVEVEILEIKENRGRMNLRLLKILDD